MSRTTASWLLTDILGFLRPRPPVRFDDDAFAEDLAHASRAGRTVGERERARLERDGIAIAALRAYEPQARDGTQLPRCVKTYVPAPDGVWRMVFGGERSQDATATLLCLGFGPRPPGAPWQPSVYQVAYRRLARARDRAASGLQLKPRRGLDSRSPVDDA
jgi:hypothetical protein